MLEAGGLLARARRTLRLLRLRAELPLLFRGATLPELLARFDAQEPAPSPRPSPPRSGGEGDRARLGAASLGPSPPQRGGEGDMGEATASLLSPRLGGGRGRVRGAADPADALLASVERLFRPLRFWPTTCLWRALGGYAALRAAGAPVRLLIGVRVMNGELLAHAWLERDGKPSLGAAGAEGYTVAFAWPADAGIVREVARMPGIAPAENVVLTELRDGTGVLLHLDSKVYFTLNRTGVLTWKLLGDAGARDADELAARLAREFPDVDPAAVRGDVAALVDELVREKLVVRSP